AFHRGREPGGRAGRRPAGASGVPVVLAAAVVRGAAWAGSRVAGVLLPPAGGDRALYCVARGSAHSRWGGVRGESRRDVVGVPVVRSGPCVNARWRGGVVRYGRPGALLAGAAGLVDGRA